MRYYYDTSALCRYYHAEPGSDAVLRLIVEPTNQTLVSRLTILETQSAFAIKVRTGLVDPAQFTRLRKLLKADIVRRFPVVRMVRSHFELAERLLERYGLLQRLRSLDALHLAIAIQLRDAGRIDGFVTADTLLVDVAGKEGLVVVDPLR